MRLTVLSTLLVFWAASVSSQVLGAGSARMELNIAGITAEADYWPGDADLPAVLVVHGFLQTREFSTVQRLAEGLANEGFSVLAPSLTLGFNRRQQSVACEALHTHSMETDVAEIRAWAEWLAERSGKRPVVVGHSAGGVQVSALLGADGGREVSGAVLISLSPFGEQQEADTVAAVRARAAADLVKTPEAMRPYALTYCRIYVTTAGNLLSYLDWDKESLARVLTASPVPVTVIYGSEDGYMDRNWLGRLATGGVGVREVAGANHFFDLANEFELLDEVLRVMNEVGRG